MRYKHVPCLAVPFTFAGYFFYGTVCRVQRPLPVITLDSSFGTHTHRTQKKGEKLPHPVPTAVHCTERYAVQVVFPGENSRCVIRHTHHTHIIRHLPSPPSFLRWWIRRNDVPYCLIFAGGNGKRLKWQILKPWIPYDGVTTTGYSSNVLCRISRNFP